PAGLVLRPPASVYRILSRMVCGTAPEPAELPYLLDLPPTTAAAAAAAAAAGVAAAASSASQQSPAQALRGPQWQHPALPLTSRLLAAYWVLCECARSCAAIMLETAHAANTTTGAAAAQAHGLHASTASPTTT
ncbi:hypothetical protein Agub_g9042, partial [Astrephomene gubernaculifera]